MNRTQDAMLILTRNIMDKIMIGDEIVVAILGVNGCQVRMGITAPNNVTVHRAEIYRKIMEKYGEVTVEARNLYFDEKKDTGNV